MAAALGARTFSPEERRQIAIDSAMVSIPQREERVNNCWLIAKICLLGTLGLVAAVSFGIFAAAMKLPEVVIPITIGLAALAVEGVRRALNSRNLAAAKKENDEIVMPKLRELRSMIPNEPFKAFEDGKTFVDQFRTTLDNLLKVQLKNQSVRDLESGFQMVEKERWENVKEDSGQDFLLSGLNHSLKTYRDRLDVSIEARRKLYPELPRV